MLAQLCRQRTEVPFAPNMQTALQAMDVALKQTVSLRDETKVFARAIFWRDDTKSRSLGDGAEVIPLLLVPNMSSWPSYFHLSVGCLGFARYFPTV